MSTIPATRATSDLDPFSPEFRADPYRHYAELRAAGPVVRLERYGIWAVSHYELVRTVLTDWNRFCNSGGGGLANYFKQKPWRPPSIILEADPPLHTRTRAILTRILSPVALKRLREGFESQAGALVGRVLARGRIDAIPELAQVFPLTVFADAVGIGPEDRENLLTYGAMVFAGMGPPDENWQRLMKQAETVVPWILARCKREALAGGGFGQMIYQAADAGEITEEEAGMLVRSFLSAGVDTTIDSIGLALRCLAENPDQWQALRDDPSLARAAFEEATRFDSSSQSLFRTTTEEVELAGTRIGKHEKVMVFIGSANRDPEQWPDADRFDIRRRTIGHVGFGVGIHGCVAQMVARMEGEILLQALAQKTRHIEITGTPALRLTPGLRGLTTLPMALYPKAA
jgi:cytochrome P450